eukprot:gnl/TRDRNA2_/TRDRNA2_186969_c0_seq1.p1 gnl/TRDRNA2_/TRDRNA2_186969_c0~~gnl/TRDRNA2_/TRDRNA2_186969_c0_seq1.p1  ORF type:complete len:536 (+),score=52.26 gnl/TRDRNA2_/TRDRNA2_186969_c0_seq1:77-1684(+)
MLYRSPKRYRSNQLQYSSVGLFLLVVQSATREVDEVGLLQRVVSVEATGLLSGSPKVAAVTRQVPEAPSQQGSSSAWTVLPQAFEGRWKGVPVASPVGPWDAPFYWGIRRGGAEPGQEDDWHMQANFDYFSLEESSLNSSTTELGWHSWYLQGSGEFKGLAHLCGSEGYFSSQFVNPADAMWWDAHPFVLSERTEHSASLCLIGSRQGVRSPRGPWPSDCDGCSCLNFTMTHNPQKDELYFNIQIAPPVVHLEVIYTRDGPPPPLVNMAFGPSGPCQIRDLSRLSWHGHRARKAELSVAKDKPVKGCPYYLPHARASHAKQRSGDMKAAISHRAAMSKVRAFLPLLSPYQHCYDLAPRIGLRLEWDYDVAGQRLHISVSAITPEHHYVSVGFKGQTTAESNPEFLGMTGTDVVLGYPGCVRTMYAEQYADAPKDDSTSLNISNSSVSYVNGRTILRFTMAMAAGHNSRIPQDGFVTMFAAGSVLGTQGADSCEGSYPGHHYMGEGDDRIRSRFFRKFNWERPEFILGSYERCMPE